MVKKGTKTKFLLIVCENGKVMGMTIFIQKQRVNSQCFSHIRTEILKTGNAFYEAYHGSESFCMILYGIYHLIETMAINLV